MADKVVLKAEIREALGTKNTVRLRKQGKCPAVVYGHGEEPVSIALNLRELVKELHQGHRLFEVEMGSKKENLLIKEVQYDHFGKDIIHADFMRVDLAELVRVTVEVAFKGNAPGSEAGGMLDHHLDQVEIECKVSDIPESLECSINEMEIGGSIHARDVVLPAGAKLVTDPGALLLTCHLVAEVKSTEEVEGEMPTAPEVITEKAPEEDEAK
jgi:large subunit ribosomal protein L25